MNDLSGKDARLPFIATSFLALSVVVTLGCGGASGGGSSSMNPPAPDPQLNQSINHIVFMVQENRGFDHYFGKLADYWQANGFPEACTSCFHWLSSRKLSIS